jgi:hypothetical protein
VVGLLFHVLTSCVAEELCGAWSIGDTARFFHDKITRRGWVTSVLKEGLKAARKHLLKSNHEYAVHSAVANHVSCNVQACRTCRAVVIHIKDWNLCHAKLVEDTLPAGRVSVAVACDTLIHVVVVDVSVQHRLHTGFETKFCVVDFAAWFDKLGHTDAEHIAWLRSLLFHHFGRVWDMSDSAQCMKSGWVEGKADVNSSFQTGEADGSKNDSKWG